MLNHRFLKILRILSPAELRKFCDFIHSPFFNKSGKLIKLYERLIKDYPDLEFINVTDESLHIELFPKLKYNCSTIRHLFSDLYCLAERFLIELNFQNRKFEKIGFLIDEMQCRKNDEFMESLLNKQENMLDNKKVAGSHFYLNKFKAETDRFNFMYSIPSSFHGERATTTLEALNNRNKYLSLFFFAEILKSIDTIQIVSRKYNNVDFAKFTRDLIDKIDIQKMLLFLGSHPDLADFSITLNTYYKLLVVFSNMDSDTGYFELKEEIKNNLHRYPIEEKSFIYKKLIDYCLIRNKLRFDTAVFDNEMFSLYSDIIKFGLYRNSETNYFPADLFRNIIILSLRLKKYEWTEDFIKSYSAELPGKLKLNIVNFSYASVYFERSDFERSLYYISRLKLNNNSLKLDTKSLLLRIYYELDYFESLMSLSAAYKEFLLKAESISKTKKKSHLEYVKFTQSLMLLKYTKNEEMLEIQKKRIESSKNLINRNWLLEKMNLLIKSIK